MTVEKAEARINSLRTGKVRCMKLDFRGQTPIEYLKVEVFEEEITENVFHWVDKWKTENGQWKNVKEIVDWKKNFIFLLGSLCGIESRPFIRERQGKYSFVAKAIIDRTLPSGSRESQSASYEYDAEIRAEETILKNMVKFNDYEAKKAEGKTPKYETVLKYQSEPERRLLVVENAKYGAQKADSGAQKRAIIKMLKLPSPSVDLLGVHVFCYRCVPNFDSQAVRKRFLTHDPSGDLFGAQTEPETIDGEFTDAPDDIE